MNIISLLIKNQTRNTLRILIRANSRLKIAENRIYIHDVVTGHKKAVFASHSIVESTLQSVVHLLWMNSCFMVVAELHLIITTLLIVWTRCVSFF